MRASAPPLRICSSSVVALLFLLAATPTAHSADTPDARDIVQAAIQHWRGLSSYSEMTMTIHRPEWERSMSMRTWTEGDKRSLVRVTGPARDRGNGTLMDDDRMWTFSPKINRVIKVPSSMMNQSWMGSDFSNKDVSRADDIVERYTHQVIETRSEEGRNLYVIEAIPREDAAVVWGREELEIREDHVVLNHRFYDQDGVLVKELQSLEVGEMGGRTVALRQRMANVENAGEWTEIRIDAVDYDVEHPPSLFTLSNLRNPRER